LSGLEAAVGRALSSAAVKAFGKARQRRQSRQLRARSRPTVPMRVADGLLEELSGAETSRLMAYLGSPDFEEIIGPEATD
jgi:hypothetical protein